ncbi:unnamed protein product [Paramecium primaurelia]|uniref:Uncharacterized protein n=2 Tax=Paramecium TaxID=5884 RepID=A0A8S1U0M3_9CILI|nr:unnamed protein product [Paramecium primaurelia]CAD8157864.1 unnamed protein product [Paramecium pentaurelia]
MGKIQLEKEDKNLKKDKKFNKKKTVLSKGDMDVEKPMGIKKKVIKQTNEQIKQKQLKKKVHQLNQIKTQTQTDTQKKAEIFKEFNKNLDEQIQIPKTSTKGQRERLLKKQKILKKKLLDKYIITKQKQEPQTFILDSLKNNLLDIDKQHQEKQKQLELEKNKGTSSHLRNKLLKEDQIRMKQVFQIKPFQDNPLATMKMHLENTYSKK